MYGKSGEETGKLFTIAERQKGMPDCIGECLHWAVVYLEKPGCNLDQVWLDISLNRRYKQQSNPRKRSKSTVSLSYATAVIC